MTDLTRSTSECKKITLIKNYCILSRFLSWTEIFSRSIADENGANTQSPSKELMFNQLSNHFIIIRIFYSPSEKSGCSFFCPIRSDSEFSRLFSSATVNDFHFLALKNWREWRKTKIATCLTQEWGNMKTQNKLQVEDCPLNREKNRTMAANL